jgi:hypothetical protein
LKKRDDIGVGFIVGVFAGAILIGVFILPQSENALAKAKAYLDMVVPLATALLAASIAYIGNKIARDNANRDRYRHNWEKLTAWRDMYKWLSFSETKPNEFMELEHKKVWRLSNYLALSEDPSQPPEIVKGSLPRFNLDDLSEILQELSASYTSSRSKIDQLESNCSSLKKVTEEFFTISLDWNFLTKELRLVKEELYGMDPLLKRCNKLRNGIKQAREKSELNGDHPYKSVIAHLREHKEQENLLTYDEVFQLKESIEALAKKYSELCSNMNAHYQSFCPVE